MNEAHSRAEHHAWQWNSVLPNSAAELTTRQPHLVVVRRLKQREEQLLQVVERGLRPGVQDQPWLDQRADVLIQRAADRPALSPNAWYRLLVRRPVADSSSATEMWAYPSRRKACMAAVQYLLFVVFARTWHAVIL